MSVVECFETARAAGTGGSGPSGYDVCGVLLMDQASLLDGLALDAFSVEQNGLAAAEIDVSWGQVAQALVAARGSPVKTRFPVRKGSLITTELPDPSR